MSDRYVGVISVRKRGVIRLPAEQAWFWTKHWQAMEREAGGDIEAGLVERAKTAEELFEILDDQK